MDKELDWLWKHSHYPCREKNGEFWIGTIGPFKTKRQAIRAAIKIEEAWNTRSGGR